VKVKNHCIRSCWNGQKVSFVSSEFAKYEAAGLTIDTGWCLFSRSRLQNGDAKHRATRCKPIFYFCKLTRLEYLQILQWSTLQPSPQRSSARTIHSATLQLLFSQAQQGASSVGYVTCANSFSWIFACNVAKNRNSIQ